MIVEHGGHNVYVQSPGIGEIVPGFLRGAIPTAISLEPPTVRY